jgi:hypothetical protein
MATTYTLISSNVLSSTATSVTFSSIPATYTDLVLRVSARSNTASTVNDNFGITVNNSTTTYSLTRLTGTGSAVSSSRLSSGNSWYGDFVPGASATASTFGSMELYFPSYTSSQNKVASITSISETNATAASMSASAFLWQVTDTISSIKILSDGGGNLVTGSSFYLYGIKNS